MLGDQDVEGVGQRRREAGRDAAAVERDPAPDLDDEREAGERKGEGEPDPSAHVLAIDEPRPERDEERREVLEEERDPDRQPVDRDEVEPLHEREPADAEQDEQGKLARAQAEPAAVRQREDEREPEKRAGRPHLRQSQNLRWFEDSGCSTRSCCWSAESSDLPFF